MVKEVTHFYSRITHGAACGAPMFFNSTTDRRAVTCRKCKRNWKWEKERVNYDPKERPHEQ
jgi:hypothetical protein